MKRSSKKKPSNQPVATLRFRDADELAAYCQACHDRSAKPLRRTKNALATAVHEAGHAIAFLADGVRVHEVRVMSGGSGECTGEFDQATWKRHDRLMFLMAGPIAELLYGGGQRWPTSLPWVEGRRLSADAPPIGWVRRMVSLQARDPSGDFTKAINVGTERQVWLACRRAARLCIRREAGLLRLADELLRRRKLCGNALIQAVAAGTPPPVIAEARLKEIRDRVLEMQVAS